MTRLSKPVTRHTSAVVRDGGKVRELVVSLYPGNVLGLRPAGTRKKREELLPLEAAYGLAVKLRVRAEQRDRTQRKGVRRGARI